jgi:uncharacterized protein (DUF169 family)
MKKTVKETFLKRWKKYFDDAELPLAAYYTDEETVPENEPSTRGCLVADLNKVRNGTPLRFGHASIGCPGGRRYSGFSEALGEGFEYFLSYGIPGEIEGERYKKSPELVRKLMRESPLFAAPGRYLVFKRWDQLDESDEPELVIFFAEPDVIAGLFTLANYDAVEDGVVAPFGSGCSSIIMHPYLEGERDRPRCVLGMFDPSARPHVGSCCLTFAAPMNRFTQMVENMPESFLITPTWGRIKKRL